MQFVLKVLVATTMVHVFIYAPYMNQLIKEVNQISFKYQKLACHLNWLILTVNNVSLKVGTWVGGKADFNVLEGLSIFDHESVTAVKI